ncbi:hypothetical protein [Mesorhizobium escarrei]|uniref:hypothetical protein n=1 Tax=Mesorhizobium escarrei TaxID=666018 RepID=UPI0020A83588|nr:hypothetical protein [Mesorhizobium escarrei]
MDTSKNPVVRAAEALNGVDGGCAMSSTAKRENTRAIDDDKHMPLVNSGLTVTVALLPALISYRPTACTSSLAGYSAARRQSPRPPRGDDRIAR